MSFLSYNTENFNLNPTHILEMQSNLTRTSSQLEKCKLEIQVLGSRLQEAIVHPTRISEDLPHETDVSDQVLDKISQKLNVR